MKYHLIISFLFRIQEVHSAIIIQSPVQNITVNYCTIYKKVIATDAYVDGNNNAATLTLELLDGCRNVVLPTDDYVQFDADTRTLYIVPVSVSAEDTKASSPQLLKYCIKVRNANGENASDMFYVNITGDYPERNYGFHIESNLIQASNIDYINLYNHVDKLYQYFETSPTEKVIQVYSYISLTTGEIKVKYQNCTIRETPCDDGNNLLIENKLIVRTGSKGRTLTVAQEFSDAMKPQFEIQAVTPESFGACTAINYGPKFNSAKYFRDYIPRYPWKFSLNSFPGFLVLPIPIDFITHEIYPPEDIQITVTRTAFSLPSVPLSYWVNIRLLPNTTSLYTLYITLTDAAWSQMKFSMISFYIKAVDPRNKHEYVTMAMTVAAQPESYYVVTFTFSNWQFTQNINIASYYMQAFLEHLISRFSSIYIDIRNIIYLKSFVFSTTTGTSGTATWGLNVTPGCNVTIIQAVQKIMFVSLDVKDINPDFKTSVSSLFTLNTVEETFSGPCEHEIPYKRRTLPMLEVPFCGLFNYTIPADAFWDNQDGGTRELSLRLVNQDKSELTDTSWIMFDETQQTIYALLPNTADKTISGRYTFKLLVTDKSNLQIECDIIVSVIGSRYPILYRIDLLGKYTPVGNSKAALVVARKVSNWFGSSTDGFQLVSHDKTSSGEEFISFSNCTWTSDRCDVIAIDYYKKMIFTDTGTVITSFKDSFKPEFMEPTFTQTIKGICTTDNDPKINKTWGPLNISPCSTFISQVPGDTFIDDEQGNTRNLRLTFQLFRDQNVASLPYWVQFNEDEQTVTMLPFATLTPISSSFQLKAFDIKQQSAIQNVISTVQLNSDPPSHVITMKIKIIKVSLNSFISIYSSLRNKIKAHFKDTIDTVEYISMSQYPNIIYEVKWTNCTVSRTECTDLTWLRNTLLVNNNINPSFRLSLESDFTIESLSFDYDGICIDVVTPPTVLNLIPDQNIGYCSYLKYQIPENTFSDKIDGGTRDLDLSVTFSNGSHIPASYWLGFNTVNQEVIAVLRSTNVVTETSHTFKVIATTQRNLAASTELKVNIIGEPLPEKSYLHLTMLVGTSFRPPAHFNTYSEAFATIIDKISVVYNIPFNKLHIYYANYLTAQHFIVARLINCGYVNCTDEPIPKMSEVVKTTSISGYLPEFSVTNKFIRDGIPCIDRKPIVVLPIPPFNISRCSAFRKSISREVFRDEDGPEGMSYIISYVNGRSGSSYFEMFGLDIVGMY